MAATEHSIQPSSLGPMGRGPARLPAGTAPHRSPWLLEGDKHDLRQAAWRSGLQRQIHPRD
jgi:hypothetical protein